MKGSFFTFACVFLFSLMPTQARAADTVEDILIKAMMVYCLPPIVSGQDVARMAENQKLPELPKEKAALFSKNGARVFAIPQAMGNAVLIASAEPKFCELAIRQANAKQFWERVDIYFGEKSPFKKIEENFLSDAGLQKNYSADFKGKTALFISMREDPKQNGMQGLMTFSRVKE